MSLGHRSFQSRLGDWKLEVGRVNHELELECDVERGASRGRLGIVISASESTSIKSNTASDMALNVDVEIWRYSADS